MAQPAFQVRTNLSRTITYRPHLRPAYYTMMALAGVSLPLACGMASMAYLDGSIEVAAVVAFFGALIPSVFFAEARLFLKPMAFVKIHVHQYGLTLENPTRTTELQFKDVKSISFSHLPYVGGWFTLVMESGSHHRFTVGLERSEYILEMLVSARPDVVDTMKMLDYRRTAVLTDHSWARAHEHFKKYKTWLLKYLAVPVVLTAEWLAGIVLYAQQSVPTPSKILGTTLIMVAANLIMGIFVTFAAEEFCILARGRRNLMADASYLKRDLEFEKQAGRLSYTVHWILALAITALVVVSRT